MLRTRQTVETFSTHKKRYIDDKHVRDKDFREKNWALESLLPHSTKNNDKSKFLCECYE